MALWKTKPSRTDFEREALPHLSALYGSALRLTRNSDEAGDLVQETMLRAFRFFNTFQAGTNCKAWLFRILTNVFRNRYREREREGQILAEAESSEANLERFTSGERTDSETALLGKIVSVEVEAALRAVPSEFRMAVVLADLEDFSYKEIAEIMECPAGTVMSRLFRGRKMLQEMLLGYAIEQGIVNGSKDATAAPAPDAPLDLDSYRKSRAGGGTAP